MLDEEPETKRVLPQRSASSEAGFQGGYRPLRALQELAESMAPDRTSSTSETSNEAKRSEANRRGGEGRVNFQQSAEERREGGDESPKGDDELQRGGRTRFPRTGEKDRRVARD